MSNELVEIAKDGLINAEEKKRLKEMCDLLDQIKASVDELRNIVED